MSKDVVLSLPKSELFWVREELLNEEFKIRTTKVPLKNRMKRQLEILCLVSFVEQLMILAGI